MTNVLYLNNRGNRWIVVHPVTRKKLKVAFIYKGEKYTRTPVYFEQFGNFATMRVSIKGKVLDIFPEELEFIG
jgi:hypothetical protein